MKAYLAETTIVDYTHPEIQELATRLAEGCTTDAGVAQNCYRFVRDEISHTGDRRKGMTTCRASDVLRHKTGWCYAKSHLLAALLRANNIPAGFCYQRLRCDEYEEGVYCLHGLNALYLKEYGWYRVDARGNKQGVNARFEPPREMLAFALLEDEFDLPGVLAEPLDVVVEALQRHTTYDAMVGHFPDI